MPTVNKRTFWLLDSQGESLSEADDASDEKIAASTQFLSTQKNK